MTAKEFREWQAAVGMSGREVAEHLGLSQNTISAYRSNGVPPAESPRVRLACAAIKAKLAPWGID